MAVEAPVKVKAEQIEGLREVVARILAEEKERLFPFFYKDMEEIRRSPVGALIRLESEVAEIKETMATREAVEALSQRVARIEETMATKEELEALSQRVARIEETMATKEELEALSQRVARIEEAMATKEDLRNLTALMEVRFQEQDKRILTLRNVFFGFIATFTPLQIAILVKLFLG